jgi:hypothetical protein
MNFKTKYKYKIVYESYDVYGLHSDYFVRYKLRGIRHISDRWDPLSNFASNVANAKQIIIEHIYKTKDS